MLPRRKRRMNDWGWGFGLWRSANSYKLPINGGIADGPVDGILDT